MVNLVIHLTNNKIEYSRMILELGIYVTMSQLTILIYSYTGYMRLCKSTNQIHSW